MVTGLVIIVGALAAEHHAFSGVGYLTGRKLPETNGAMHAEDGSAAGSAGSKSQPAADCTSQSLGFRLLEGHGFGQVAYPRWKAACLRERSTLGGHAHKALPEAGEHSASYTLTRSCIMHACPNERILSTTVDTCRAFRCCRAEHAGSV